MVASTMLISPAKPSSSTGSTGTYNKRMRATLALAALSKCRHKHAALLFLNGQLRASSVNILREPPPSISPTSSFSHLTKSSNSFRTSSLHAEEAALLIAGPNLPRGAILYVARVSNGKPMNSHPCKRCMSKLLRAGVRRVVYTVSEPTASSTANSIAINLSERLTP